MVEIRKLLGKKRSGFTLVELLIVIIIIGILAGMMMLSTGAATDKAEATKIISDMRNVKSAAHMYFADYNEYFAGDDLSTSLDKYTDQKLTTDYAIANTGDQYAVKFAGTLKDGVKSKLAAGAQKAGLYKDISGDAVYTGGDDTLYMPIN